MSLKKNDYDFVCEPNSIKIIAKNYRFRRRLDVELQVNGKVALSGAYPIEDFTPEEARKKIKVFCNALLRFTEDEIQDWCEEDRIMRALYAYRSLKKVWTKTGGLIWEKP